MKAYINKEIEMSKEVKLSDVIKEFDLDASLSSYGNGHINDTYLIQPNKYILQRINTAIFKNPDTLMENIMNVTEFLKNRITSEGGDPDRETLSVVKTRDGKNFYKYDENNCFRVYKFITDTIPIETADKPEQLYNAARGFAKFQKRLSDFPADTLYETIENFHNTPVRYNNLLEAIENDVMGRAKNVKEEIDFALAQKEWIGQVIDGLADGSIPLRVTHNDTKINNVLFDKDTEEAVCVIDLDTVMPGSLLYDFGDALRIGAATAPEDETDLSKLWFDLDYFKAFSKGFAEEIGDSLTEKEIELLPLSAKLLTYECGIRFLTDYLNGDTYFKIHRPNHNLDRARTQFKLVQDMDTKFDEMKRIVRELY